jgi:hypothetical protein
MQSTSRILGFACSVAESGLLAPPPMHLGTSAAPLGPTPLVPRLSYLAPMVPHRQADNGR